MATNRPANLEMLATLSGGGIVPMRVVAKLARYALFLERGLLEVVEVGAKGDGGPMLATASAYVTQIPKVIG